METRFHILAWAWQRNDFIVIDFLLLCVIILARSNGRIGGIVNWIDGECSILFVIYSKILWIQLYCTVERRSDVPEKDSFDIAHSFSATKFVSSLELALDPGPTEREVGKRCLDRYLSIINIPNLFLESSPVTT